MSNRSGSAYSIPRDSNHVPAVGAVKASDGITVQPLEIDSSGNLLVNVAAGGGSGGTSSTFSGAFPGTGTAIGASDGVNMKPLLVDGSGNLKVTGSLSVGGTTDNSAFTAGTSTGTPSMGFYHSTIDAVTDGRAAALAIDSKRNLFNVIRDAAGNARGANVDANNNLQIGQGTAANLNMTEANSAAINTSIGTLDTDVKSNITLHAGTNLIGKVGIDQTTPGTTNAVAVQDGAGNALTSNSTTYTAKKALDGNLLGTLGTAFSTAGKVDVKAADGDVFVRQATAANLNATVVGTGTFAVQAAATLAAETTKAIGVVRNSDGAGNLLTSNSTTYTAKFGLDGNLLGTLGTAFSTAGKIDVKAADGDVFVRQATAANLNATVVGQATGSGVPTTAFYHGISDGTNLRGAVQATVANNTSGTGLQGAGTLSVAATALPSAATATNFVETMADKFGRQVVHPNGMRDLVLPMTQLTLTSSTAETTLIAQTASVFNDILSLVVINTSASATQVDFRDSTGGTIRLSLYVPAGDTRGVSLTNPLPQNAVNNNWTAKCATSVASVIITGTYITNK